MAEHRNANAVPRRAVWAPSARKSLSDRQLAPEHARSTGIGSRSDVLADRHECR